jgi:hypothetical protein
MGELPPLLPPTRKNRNSLISTSILGLFRNQFETSLGEQHRKNRHPGCIRRPKCQQISGPYAGLLLQSRRGQKGCGTICAFNETPIVSRDTKVKMLFIRTIDNLQCRSSRLFSRRALGGRSASLYPASRPRSVASSGHVQSGWTLPLGLRPDRMESLLQPRSSALS